MSYADAYRLICAETLGRIESIVSPDMDNVLPDPQRRVELVRSALTDMRTRLTAAEEEATG